jgi:hypothetical protein
MRSRSITSLNGGGFTPRREFRTALVFDTATRILIGASSAIWALMSRGRLWSELESTTPSVRLDVQESRSLLYGYCHAAGHGHGVSGVDGLPN